MVSKTKVFFKLFGLQQGDIVRVRNTPAIVEEWRSKYVEITGRSRMQYDVHGNLGKWYECVRLDPVRPDEWTVGWLQERDIIYSVRENERRLKGHGIL